MTDIAKLFGSAFHGLADAVGQIASSSAIDADTKKNITDNLNNVKDAAGKLAQAGEGAFAAGAAAAPGVAGAVAEDGVKLAAASIPAVGPTLSAIFGPLVASAVSLAVSHFEASFEAHNGNHLAALNTAIGKLADAAPTAAAATAVRKAADVVTDAQPSPGAAGDLPA